MDIKCLKMVSLSVFALMGLFGSDSMGRPYNCQEMKEKCEDIVQKPGGKFLICKLFLANNFEGFPDSHLQTYCLEEVVNKVPKEQICDTIVKYARTTNMPALFEGEKFCTD